MADSKSSPTKIEDANIHVEITYNHLDTTSIISKVKSPKAGAIVLFAGTYSVSLGFSILFI
jgi:molybdopterin synthase catalytic subunit